MPKEFSRIRRIEELLCRELAGLIENEMSDPRARLVTITSADVSKDLHYARVFFTVVGSDAAHSAEAARALNHAAGFLRHRLRALLDLKTVPALEFRYDENLEHARELMDLIESTQTREPEQNE
jgi:ribosome-binding factor A